MKKPIVLFDIDRTLLDNKALREKYWSLLTSELGLDNDKIRQTYDRYKVTLKADRYFRPRNLTRMLSEEWGIDQRKIMKISFGNPDIYIPFTDVGRTFQTLKENFILGVWTEGVREFQFPKVKHLNIYDVVDHNHIYIFPNKTTPYALSKLPDQAIIIDDKPFNIETLLKHGRQTPVWINRDNEDKHNKATTVKTLSEFTEWLLSRI